MLVALGETIDAGESMAIDAGESLTIDAGESMALLYILCLHANPINSPSWALYVPWSCNILMHIPSYNDMVVES